MKSTDIEVYNAIRYGYDIQAVPRLTVEWNLNRYTEDCTADNTPPEQTNGFDIENFPIESIIASDRPTAGILKARVNEARIADPYDKYTGKNRAIRSYLGSVDDTYKYWTSPVPTDSSGNFPKWTDGITQCRPHVNYPSGVKANRIVVNFEDSWAQPNSFTVRVATTPGGAYNTVSTNPAINDAGQVILNWDTTWSTTNSPSEDFVNMPLIYGIEVRVDSLGPGAAPLAGNGANSALSLIEISARRVHDLSNRLVSVNDTFDMSEKSIVYPIGTLTSNTAEVTLYNEDGAFNAENTDSIYYGLMEPNAKFMLDWIYTVDDVEYVIPEFTMLGDAWAGQRAETVSVDLIDFSKNFQEIKPRAAMYLKAPVSQIVWRLCDSIGFVDYEIQLNDTTSDSVIQVWYTDGSKTMWELLDDLAKGTQTAIYFDSYGKLQVRSRSNAFDGAKTINWTLRGEDYLKAPSQSNPNPIPELADIITLSQTDELESNVIDVAYQTTDIDPVVNGLSKTQVLWQPDGDVVLRACPLYATFGASDPFFVIAPAEAQIWPYSGMANIEGEFIRWDSKEYVYYVNGVRKSANVTSADDKSKYDGQGTDTDRVSNFFTGRMHISLRGEWNTTAKAHSVDANGYSVRSVMNNENHKLNVSGFKQNKAESRVYLNPGPHHTNGKDLLIATIGSQSDPGFYQYGTKIRFTPGGGNTQRAGIMIHNQQGDGSNSNLEDGYYIELTPTAKLDAKKRARRNEVTLWTRSAGNWHLQGKGAAFNIAEGVDYEVDIQFRNSGSNHVVYAWINGKEAYGIVIPPTYQSPFNGKFGMFTRGDTNVSYEYLYAKDKTPIDDLEDDFSFLDRISGGNVGGQLDREGVYRFRTEIRRVKRRFLKVEDKYLINFFDEFGPICHEIREFDVKFTKGPAIDSRLYMSNDWAAVCPEYSATAWSGKFYIANAARSSIVINGEDNLTYAGSSSTVNNVLSVIGRSITVSDGETVTAKNDFQVRKRGEITTEVDSTWIQSKEMAQEIADWISAHWSEGADEQEVSIFGNPLIELGDVLAVEYAEMDMTTATHTYFVTGIKNSFDTGLETVVTLRRVISS